MKKKVSAPTWVQRTSFLLLVVFQALFLLFSSYGTFWFIDALCLIIDGILWVAVRKAFDAEKVAQRAQIERADEALRAIVELTQSQQRQWSSTLKGLEQLEPEDLAAQGLRRLTAAEDFGKGHSIVSIANSVQKMILLSHDLATNLESVMEFYHETYLRLRRLQAEYRLNHFRLKETVGFLTDMGCQTNKYSESLILEVLESFREIASFSDGISNDVLGRIRTLMDSKNPESLEAISRGSAQIKNTMDGFFVDLGKANTYSEKAIHENLTQMARVQEMAVAIGEFSESIRMISLNLNIEAARGKNQAGGATSGKTFQVLAAKLSEFAVKAGELAKQQHTTIETASTVMAKTGRAQMAQLGLLMDEIPKIKNQLNPFDAIIRQSYAHFESVVATMEQLSSSINEKLKAVIGKFQFQDLVRQEQEHTVLMLKNLWQYANQINDSGAQLSDAVKSKALDELLTAFETMASTENEHAVLREFRNKTAPSSGDRKVGAPTAGSVSLF